MAIKRQILNTDAEHEKDLTSSGAGVEYDANTDYMKKIYQALGKGDYTAAAQYERQRNAKIDGEGLTAAKTNYTYTPQYDTQINDLFNKLINRESFSYNTVTDPLYQQYKEQYVNQGKLAMQDTMGQAAALTGGYGSSYSQAVGQQQYDAYLQKLNEVVPELYQQAYSQYEAEGDELRNLYNMYLAKDAQDYERAQTNYAQLQNQMAATAEQVSAIISSGGTPSDDLVLRSGLSDEYVQALKNYYASQLAAQTAASSSDSSDKWAKGISTELYKTKTGAVQPSSWDYTKQNMTQLLRSGDINTAYKYMDQIVDELSKSQYNELVTLIEKYEGRS